MSTDNISGLSNKIHSFKEHEIFMKNLEILIKNTLSEREFQEFLGILDQYQKSPRLLDPYLENIISLTINSIIHKNQLKSKVGISSIVESNASDDQEFILLYRLCKTRGYKTIYKFFPNQIHIEFCENAIWEKKYILMLWISLVIMIPFNLTTVNIDRNFIMEIGEKVLYNHGKEYEAAALMLARFITRRDQQQYFKEYIVSKLELQNDLLKIKGILQLLCQIYKLQEREFLLEIENKMIDFAESMELGSDNFNRKLYVKLVSRIGLAMMSPKVECKNTFRNPKEVVLSLATSGDFESNAILSNDTTTLEESVIPDGLDFVISTLMENLFYKQTFIRWSASKGIARICSRLPILAVNEIINNTIEIMTENMIGNSISICDDFIWHGGTLLFSEMARRGLISPSSLNLVLPIMLRALSFEIGHATYGVGSNVRDAACYFFWSLGRSYSMDEIQNPTLIASKLVSTALLDREVSVRKAASAAFQENAGRHTLFPHRIDLVELTDFFMLGNRNHCYSKIIEVAEFPEYRHNIILDVVDKVSHWDPEIRQHAADCCGILAELYPSLFIEPLMNFIRLDGDYHVMHGKFVGIAAVFQKLNDKTMDSDILTVIDNLSTKLLDGYGSELVRKSICYFIEKVSNTEFIKRCPKVIPKWLHFLYSTVGRQETVLQLAARDAFSALLSNIPFDEKVIDHMLSELRTGNKYLKCGYSLVLGKLPEFIYFKCAEKIIDGLAEEATELKNAAECRKSAIESLINILVIKSDPNTFKICANVFHLGIQDYTTDSRGDVGSWIREVSLQGIFQLFLRNENQDALVIVVAACFEKIDRLRDAAVATLNQMLKSNQECVVKNEILLFFQEVVGFREYDVFPILAPLLHLSSVRKVVLLGLMINIGALTESLVTCASKSLLDFIESLPAKGTTLEIILNEIVLIWNENLGNDRITTVILQTLQLLIESGVLMQEPPEEPIRQLFNLVKKEVLKSKNTRKILLAIQIMNGFSSNSDVRPIFSKMRKLAQDKLIFYLGHPFSVVRTAAVEALFSTLASNLESLGEKYFETESILLEENWDDLNLCKKNRERIKTLFSN